jgi:hypothetical protein
VVEKLNVLDLNLDWALVRQRLAKDLRDDFWPDPLGFRDILGADGVALERLKAALTNYSPRPGLSYDVPKANFTIRDSIYISALDRLVYQALVDHLIIHIDPLLSAGVFSHRLRGDKTRWIFHSGVKQWRHFLDAIRTTLSAAQKSWLVITDLSQYFETVRFNFLKRHLEEILSEKLTVSLQGCIDVLMKCLRTWSPYNGYGLPQNMDPSSFLGNVLLDRVDKRMERDGFQIARYIDDIRVIVPSEADARKALMKLVAYLRDIGLGLNSAKTEVIAPGSERLDKYLFVEDPEVSIIERAIATKRRVDIQEVVPLLFDKAQRLLENGQTGERIFRFCLNRIATLRAYGNLELPNAHSLTTAVLRLLVLRPAETDTFCRYLEVAPLSDEHCAELESLLTDEPLCVYMWQNFQLWRLASQHKIKTDKLIRKAHTIISSEIVSPVSAAVALYLGADGDYVDREAIQKKLATAPGAGMVKRCLLIAIQELNKPERNATYGHHRYRS